MTPEEFGSALDALVDAAMVLVTLPLEAMSDYVDEVEQMGERNPAAFTAPRREATAHAGRLVAAATLPAPEREAS